MLFYRKAAVILITTLLGFSSFASANACLSYVRQDYKIFRTAKIILRAKVIGYSARPDEHRAFFEFETIEVVAGLLTSIPKLWTAEWTNSTFGEPKSWKAPRYVIVGLEAEIDRNGQPILSIVQQSCSQPSILSDDPENLRAVLTEVGMYRGAHHPAK